VVEARRFAWVLGRFGRSSRVWNCRSPLLLVGEAVVVVGWGGGLDGGFSRVHVFLVGGGLERFTNRSEEFLLLLG
jgi:hypothetical protein